MRLYAEYTEFSDIRLELILCQLVSESHWLNVQCALLDAFARPTELE